jgi:hypothetical protein
MYVCTYVLQLYSFSIVQLSQLDKVPEDEADTPEPINCPFLPDLCLEAAHSMYSAMKL